MFQEWLKTVNYPGLFQIWVGGNLEHFYEGKAEKWGREFRVIDRWQLTCQVCSCCGFRGGKLDLSGARMGMP